MWFYTAFITSVISAIAVIFIFTFQGGIPQLNYLFFFGVIGSVLFYIVSQVVGFKAMRMANLSAIWPLISLGPIFTLLIALLPPLSERPSIIATSGVFLTLVGVYLLNATKLKGGVLEPIKSLFNNKASLLMMFSVLTNSVVIVFD